MNKFFYIFIMFSLLWIGTNSLEAQNALNFDGSNDYVTLSNTGISATSGTVELWVNSTSTSGDQMFVDLGGEGFAIFSHGSNSIFFRCGGTQFSTTFPVGQWCHIAMTWSGNGTTFKGYINGTQVGTGTQGASAIDNTTYLGRSSTQVTYHLLGSMDEARIWNTARTVTEIANNRFLEVVGNESGLVAAYHFNQGTAGGTNIGVTTLTDATANAFNGTLNNFALSGATSNWVTGVALVGAALNFDGSNDYVTLSNTGISATAGTVELWVNSTSTSGDQMFVDLGGEGFAIFSHGSNSIFFRCGGTQFSTTFPVGQWCHIAMTWSGNGTTFKGYINGTQVGTGTQGASAIDNTTYLGRSSTQASSYLLGSIDEARIWNRTLPVCEIQNNMNCELGSGQTGLVIYYKFNQNTGTSLTDGSGNNLNGTLNNFALSGTTSNWINTGGVTTGTTCTPYIVTWTGATSTDWSNAANWSPNCVPNTVHNVIIPSTSNKPTLLANQTIVNLSLTGTNKIILGNNTLSVNAITGGSSSSYVVTDGTGTLTIKALSTSTPTTFPIGASETSYDPLSIQPTNSVDFTAKVKATTVAGDFSGSITNYAKTAKRQWDITPTGSAGSTVLTLTNGGTTYTPTTPKVGHYTTGNVWEELAATHNNGTWSATTTSFSPFGVGDAGGFVAVLPIELLSFTGYNKGTINILMWATANEVNNKGFQVERRQATGDSWDVLGFVNAKDKATTYDFTDNTPLSTSYYRLRQIDNDGIEIVSKVIFISKKSNNKLKVYPNPVLNVLTIDYTEGVDYQILNLLGQQVMNGKATQRIDVSVLPQGTYLLKVNTEVVKLIKQ